MFLIIEFGKDGPNRHRFSAPPYLIDCCLIVDPEAPDVAECPNCRKAAEARAKSAVEQMEWPEFIEG